MLVVGGFDSSNTAHLKEIPEKFGNVLRFCSELNFILFQYLNFPCVEHTSYNSLSGGFPPVPGWVFSFFSFCSLNHNNTGVEAYHIDRADCIGADNSITHRLDSGAITVHRNFLRPGPMTIGVTSGASTPDKYVLYMLPILMPSIFVQSN